MAWQFVLQTGTKARADARLKKAKKQGYKGKITRKKLVHTPSHHVQYEYTVYLWNYKF